ncbi:MAG: filamentous hemagglutinin N-terminal domain-containing protein, partial [Planctomycetota bacterium]
MRKRMMEKLRKISTMYYLRQIVACFLVYCILLAIPTQVALADIGTGGWSIPVGDADITAPGGGANAYIDMLSDRAVINWQDFDTNVGQLAEFVRTAGGNFAVLNRIIAGGATQFNGNLQAFAGDVFIVNTRGIVFGPESFIQARNFVASGIDIRNDDFMDSIYRFERFTPTEGHPYSDLIGDVTNEGIGLNHGINAELVALIGQNVTNKGVIRTTAPGGAIIMAAGDSVLLSEIGSNVVVEVDMADPAEHVVDHGGSQGTGPGTIEAPGGKVILAAGDIYSTAISGVDSLAAVANRDITLDGNIQAGEIMVDAGRDVALASDKTMISNSGDLSVTAGRDIMLGDDLSNSDPTVGSAGNVYANGDLTLAAEGSIYAHGLLFTDKDGPGGNINLYSSDNTTHLYGNVSADVDDDGDIILHNESIVANNVALTAGDDVYILKLLTALGNLTIEAKGGEIVTADVLMNANGSELSLTQNDNLDMESALDDVFNSGETYLFAKSTGTDPGEGSVTSVAAAEWKSITAEAYKNITLSDESGDITTLELYAETGDIKITANDGKLFAQGEIDAGRDVVITATDEGSAAIELYGSVYADQDILLNNNTWAAYGVEIDAGRDVKVGWDAVHEEYLPKTLTGEGDLWVEAARHITLGGDVKSDGDLKLWADYDDETDPTDFENGVGDMTALGSVKTTTGYSFPFSFLLVVGQNIQIDGFVDAAKGILMIAGEHITLGDYVTA